MPDWLSSSRVWQALGISAAVIVGLPVWRRLFPKEHHMQMGWMDWCGYYACIGALFVTAGFFGEWMALALAGGLLLIPLYPIAILGLLGRLDDTVTDIIHAIRRR